MKLQVLELSHVRLLFTMGIYAIDFGTALGIRSTQETHKNRGASTHKISPKGNVGREIDNMRDSSESCRRTIEEGSVLGSSRSHMQELASKYGTAYIRSTSILS